MSILYVRYAGLPYKRYFKGTLSNDDTLGLFNGHMIRITNQKLKYVNHKGEESLRDKEQRPSVLVGHVRKPVVASAQTGR